MKTLWWAFFAMSSLRRPGFVSFALFLVLGAVTQVRFVNAQETCVKDYEGDCDLNFDYFANQKIDIVNANETIKNIEFSKRFVRFAVAKADDGGNLDKELAKHILIKCGCGISDVEPGEKVIFTNPKSLYVEEGPALSMVVELGLLDRIGYVGDPEFIYNDDVVKEVNSETITQVPFGNTTVLKEDEEFGLALLSTFKAGVEAYDRNVAKPRLIFSEVFEDDPLGRAEWMKLIGLIFEQSAKANTTFNDIVSNYNDVKKKMENETRRPSMMFNFPINRLAEYKPELDADENYSWRQPSKDSYLARIVKDAKADFVFAFKEAEGANVDVSFSEVEKEAAGAQFLVNADWSNSDLVPPTDRTLKQFMNEPIFTDDSSAGDTSFLNLTKKLAAVRCGNVYGRNGRVRRKAVDFLESGISRPDLVLRGYAKMFHPEVDFGDFDDYMYKMEGNPGELTGGGCYYNNDLQNSPGDKKLFKRKFSSPGLNRFQIEAKMYSNLTVRQRFRNTLKVSDSEFDLVFEEEAKEKESAFSLWARLDSGEESTFNSPDVLKLMQTEISGTIRAVDPPPVEDNNPPEEPDDDGDDDGGGLGGGAIFGIILAVVVVIGVAVFLWFRARRNKRRVPLPTDPSSQPAQAGGEYGTNEVFGEI